MTVDTDQLVLDVFALQLALKAFNADQPRDELGRFAGDGGYKAPSAAEQDDAVSEMKGQMRMVADLTQGRGKDAFVLANGQSYRIGDHSFDGPRGTPKMCYMNAAQAAIADPSLTYVEGQVHIGSLAIAHAWTVDKDGVVRDPTLKLGLGGKLGAKAYFGVPFTTKYLMQTLSKTKMYGVISHTNPGLFADARFKPYKVEKAFDPDQPRDKDGKWSGGGDRSTVSAADDARRVEAAVSASDADPRVRDAEHANIARGDTRNDPGVMEDGRYTPQADAVNRGIAEGFLKADAKPPAGRAPTAIFMIGKPGAGKTTMVAAIGDSFPRSVMIAGDDIKDRIPGYTGDMAPAFHERSTDIAREYLTPMAVAGRYNLVFDMTNNIDRLVRTISMLKGAGYRVGVIHAAVSDATSAERVYSRFLSSGRYMPTRIALSHDGKPKAAYEASKGVADQWREYDTSKGRDDVRMTDQGGHGVF